MKTLFESACASPFGYRDVSPAAVAADAGRTRIIDVREPDEFDGELGHIPGAELVPMATIPTAAAGWPRDQEIVLVCRSGARSGRTAAILNAMGFSRVMNLAGGMLAWNQQGLPIDRSSA